jgi:hypothetical protein
MLDGVNRSTCELLRRVAARAGDAEPASVAARIADEERDAAQRIASTWDATMDAALNNLGVTSGWARAAGRHNLSLWTGGCQRP